MNYLKNQSTLLLFTVIILLCLLCSNCRREPYDRVDFITLEITSIESIALDSVLVRAEVKDLDLLVGTVRSYGILWSTSNESLTIETFDVNERLGAFSGDESDGKFELKLRLEPNRSFSLRAYATADNSRYFYSDVYQHQTGIGQVFTETPFYPGWFELELRGQLTGILPNLKVVEHGFCWSTTNEQPGFESDTIQLGSLEVEVPFSSTIPLDVELDGTPYYYRAYAIFKNSVSETVVFGEPMSFDGDLNYWVRIGDFPGLARWGAASFIIEDQAYVGGGHPNTETSIDECWAFNSLTETWTQKSGVPYTIINGNEQRRVDALGFSIDTFIENTTLKYGFIGTGTAISNAGRPGDFYRYDPLNDYWTSISCPSDMKLTRGVGFTIGNYSYVGLGEFFSYLLDEFWKFNLITGSWTSIANLPASGRTDAIAFAIGDKAYVGGGRTRNGFYFYDFYEYDPETDSWQQKNDIPRDFINGVAFVLNGRAYVSTNWDVDGNPLTTPSANFWEYDVYNDTWIQRAFLPVSTDLAFTVNGHAYAGLGWNMTEDNYWSPSFYRYVP